MHWHLVEARQFGNIVQEQNCSLSVRIERGTRLNVWVVVTWGNTRRLGERLPIARELLLE